MSSRSRITRLLALGVSKDSHEHVRKKLRPRGRMHPEQRRPPTPKETCAPISGAQYLTPIKSGGRTRNHARVNNASAKESESSAQYAIGLECFTPLPFTARQEST